MWAPRRKPDPKTKSSRSHLKISSNLTEICWRYLKMAVHYFVQILIPRSTRGPHLESRTLKLKARVHTLKFQRIWLKFVENVLKWQSATLWIIIPRFARGPHVESRTLKLKARVHILKFQRICQEFVGNVLEWQSVILCKLVQLDPQMWYIWKMDFMWNRTSLRCKFGLWSSTPLRFVWIHKRNGFDGVVSN
jgi:hypothetical protein